REERKAAAQVLVNVGRAPDIERATLAQRQQPRDVIDLAVDQQHGGDATVPGDSPGVQVGIRGELGADVGRGIAEQPALAIAADGDRGLGTRPRRQLAAAYAETESTIAVPLREATARRSAKHQY